MSISLRPWWAWAWPALALAIMIMTMIFGAAGATAAVAGGVLIAAVFAAVYHAEVVAHRTGEPFGTLVLALAVTIIDSLRHARSCGRQSRPRTRHGIRGGHDRLQRHCGLVSALGWHAASRAGFPGSGSECGFGRACATHNPHDDFAKLHVGHARPCLQHIAAYLCLGRFARALWFLRFYSMAASSRLLSAAGEW